MRLATRLLRVLRGPSRVRANRAIRKRLRQLVIEGLERREVFAGFTEGNIVLYRIGTGTGNLVNTGNPVFIDEFTPSGTLVQSLPMPTTASGSNKQLIASGTATSEGMLTVSPNGQFVTVTGYATNTGGSTSLSSSASATVNRSVGVITVSSGSVDTSTALSNWTSGNNPRSAVTTNGTDIWLGGGSNGVSYATKGATTATTGLTTLANIRQVNVINDQLYASNDSTSGSNTVILGTVGSGLPTTAGQSYTSLPGFITHTSTASASAYAFFFADLSSSVAGLDTLYVADDSALALTKYSLVSGNWTANGTVGADTDDYRGISGSVSGSTVTLFATRKGGTGATGGGELVSLVDSSGYNGAFVGTPTLLATAAANTAFRGVGIIPFSASAPEVNVTGNSVSIVDGDTTPSTSDHTQFPSTVAGNTNSRTFTIQNTGTADLTLSSPASSNALFAISGFPAGPITAGNSATFDVIFSPSAAGSFTSTISFGNNDSNENPYDFVVGGDATAAAAPEVNVLGNSVSIVDGDTTPSLADHTVFVDAVVGNTTTRTYTIQNTGSADLTLSSPTSSNGLFAIIGFPAGPITAGSSATFDVIFAPLTAGAASATISFGNNDSDENPYNFDVSGTGLAAVAEANVRGNGVDIADGDATPSLADHTQFVNTIVGSSSSRTFTIQNTGTVDLTLGAFTSSNALFTIPSPPSGPVTPGTSVTFNVVFAPTATGAQSSTISFVNNDGDENPYDFVVGASGVTLDPLYINEIFFNPPGNDAPNEYVEMRGVPNATIPAGTYLVGIEGDTSTTGPGQGDVQTIINLSGLTLGSNGYLVIRQSGNTYTVDASATTITATGTGFQTGVGFSADSNGTDIENTSVTFLLITSVIPPSLADDIDSDNDGVADGSVFSNWSIADSVAVIDNAGDAAYSNFVFSTTATFVGSAGKNIVVTTAASNIVARVGNSTGDTAADWVGGDIVGAAPNFALSPTNALPSNLRGARLNHIGSANNFVAAGLVVTQSGGNTEVTEGGATDSYTVALSSQPLGDVIVTLTPDAQLDLGAGAATAVTLTFTTANWNVAQSVTVTGVNDSTSEGVHSGVISHSIATGSAADYLGLNVSATNVTVTINDPLATPTITITSGNVIYSNSVYTATANVTGFNAPDPTASLTFTFYSDAGGTNVIAPPENVGTYFVRGTTTANAGNNAAQSAITQFQITPFALIASATAGNKIYDGNTNAAVSINLSGIFAGDTVTGTATGTFDSKSVGTGKTVTVGTVTLAGADAGNYTAGAAGNTTANISAKVLTANATAASKVYDGNTDAVVTIGLTGVVSGDAVTGSTTGLFSNKNVGTGKTVVVGTVLLAGGDAGNYIVGTTTNPTADITAKALSASASAASKVYDGNTVAIVSISLTGVVSGDTVNGSASGTFDNKNVGTGKTVTVGAVTLGGVDSNNYTVGSAVNPTANITPAPLTVTADAKSKTEGQADPPLTFTTSAFVGGETVATALTGSLSRASGESVGIYAINQGTLAAANGNYSISFVSANFTINAAATAPTLTSVAVNGADTFLNSAQRSMVTSLVVTFSGPVVVSSGAFTITNIGLFTASNINLADSQILVTANATNNVFTIRFGSGAGVDQRQGTGALGNSLANGNYRLTIDPTKVTNAAGNLSGNNLFGAVAADNFFRMYGDANGDGTVNAVDRSAVMSALGGAANAALDFDGNGSTTSGVDTTNYFSNNGKRRRSF